MIQNAWKYFLIAFCFSLQAQNPFDTQQKLKDFIQKSIDQKPNNNPQSFYQNFSCHSYRKIIVSAEADSIQFLDEAIFGKKAVKSNKALLKFQKLVKNQHLFVSEKVSQLSFQTHHKIFEKVEKVRMSGLKKPIYEIVSFEMQSFSLYDETYELLETDYKSPFAKNALENYHFSYIDTLQIQGRKVVCVGFKAKKTSQKNQLNGLLYLDVATGAIAKAETIIDGLINIDALHTFYYHESEKKWLPLEKTFTLAKGNTINDVKLMDGTFTFESDETAWNQQKKIADFAFLSSKTVFYDYQFETKHLENQVEKLEIPLASIEKSEVFWQNNPESIREIYSNQYPDFEPETVSDFNLNKEKQTFQYMDSLAEKEKIEKRIFQGRKLLRGYLPVGFFDFDARYLLSFNNYEGFRLGLGGVTNELFSKKIRLQTYGAYGLKDETFKYHSGIGFKINEASNTWANFSYTDDVREIASIIFYVDKKKFKLIDPRPFNITTFYNYKTWVFNAETKLFPKTNSVWQLKQSQITPLFNYQYIRNGARFSQFNYTTFSISMQWNPASNFMKTPDGVSEMSKKFPQFTFQVSKSLPEVLGNDFDFTKIDLRATYEKKYINGQKSAVLIQGGYAIGDLPITHLYSISPNNLNKDVILQRVTFAGKNSFETMYFNEFFSNRFASFQLKHELNRVKISNKIKPSLVLVSRMAWGDLDGKANHEGIDFKTLEDGFFESGIELNKVYQGLGFTFFYRYGPNQLPIIEDNLAIKVSFNIDLGL
ncbi:MAG: DUF5686 family protein [Flavobacterium sp.]